MQCAGNHLVSTSSQKARLSKQPAKLPAPFLAITMALRGTLTVQFTDCTTLHFSYQSTGGLPAGVPTGSGTRNWTRASQMNGLACQ